MKYHPDVLYAKYYFVGHLGRHIKLKMCSEMVKKGQKCKMCSINGSCRINEVLIVVFKRRDICFFFLGIVFSPKFQNYSIAKYEAKEIKDLNALGLSNTYMYSNLVFMVHLNDHVKTCSLVER